MASPTPGQGRPSVMYSLGVSADIKRPQFCRFCRSAPPSTWVGTR